MSPLARPDWRRLDWRILATLGILALLSLLFLHSAGYDAPTGRYRPFAGKQLVWILLSAGVLFGLLRVPYRTLLDHAYLLYWGGILLLLLVKVAGTDLNNARRWIDLRFMLLQPSEFMKVILIVALARYIRWRDDYKRLGGLILPFALTLLPVALILSQPDLGTALLFVPILFALLFVAGAKAKHLGLVVLMGAMAAPVLFFGFLKEYQQQRILVFLGQQSLDEGMKQNEGYHLNRSRIAVGSGGVTGKGYGHGDQRVPENETDFIFTVIAEEWGLLGSLFVIMVWLALLIFLLENAVTCREPSGKLLIVGVTTLIYVQAAVNIAMTVGLAPITGLTLPFLSYGGSSLLSLTMAVGLVLNVRLYPDFVFKRDF
jgi:rod shape determining protein RodA